MKYSRGLTLIETVVYVGVIVIVVVGMVSTLVFVSHVLGDLKITRDIKTSAQTALTRIGREIRQAESINTSVSVFDVHPGTLQLNSTATTTVEFYVEQGVVKVREDGVYAGDLTLPTATTTQLVFRQLTPTSSRAVRVELTLANTDGTGSSTRFYTTGVVRGSYND